ncbi:tetratricopeptide repeat protein, partial [Micromonospora zingiberis]
MNIVAAGSRAGVRLAETWETLPPGAIELACHAAVPVVVDPAFLNLLRINFFTDPPHGLPWTVEADLLASPLFRELGGELFEIDANLRSLLLVSLHNVYGWKRAEQVALLLERYSDQADAWSGQPYLAQAQRLTVLGVIDPDAALRWLDDAQTDANAQIELSSDWFVAMRGRLTSQPASTIQLGDKIAAAAARLRSGDPTARAELMTLGLVPGSDVKAVSAALRSVPGAGEALQLLRRLRGPTVDLEPTFSRPVVSPAEMRVFGGEMRVFDLEIFQQTSEYAELRLSTGDGPPKTRGLDTVTIDRLIEVVERDYSQHAVAQKMFGTPQLRDLGARLAAFLDGDERWMTPVLDRPPGTTLRITAAERLRHLPWELLAANGSYLTLSSHAPLLPVRSVRTNAALTAPVEAGNRPLRVLFMAVSPEGVEPVLGYEAEEAAILAATTRTGTELVVEESGSLEGIRSLTLDYGEGYFDVLHLSGHAAIGADGQPVFLMENEFGGLAYATADQIAKAMGGRWPRLIFLSGCLTANAPDSGAFPSMSESLIHAGAPAVLGWALPVGDVSATEFAAMLYRSLAAGDALDLAVVEARQHLYANKHGSWHSLRLYADRSPLAPMVTPLRTTGRARIKLRPADQDFLDPQTQLSRVAARAAFVGRRRVIQRCLRTLKQTGGDGAAEALVLAGMGGLGKSSLASRLLERMPTHQRAVWYGRVDLSKFRELTTKVHFPTPDQQIEADKLLNNDQAPLVVRLRHLLHVDGPLGQTPCLFVFDDFEDGNLDERDGRHVLSPEMADILPALLTAIRDTGSPSRVVITSRYRFPTPVGASVVVESMETLTGIEQAKKLANLPHLRPGSPIDSDIRQRAVEAAAGNPRLLDWLDLIVADPNLDVDALITAIEAEADRFRRETILATNLLDSQPAELRKMLAKVNVVELPVPADTVRAVHNHPDATIHIDRAVQLGLMEEDTDPETRQPRYYVSNVLRPLIRPLLTDDEYIKACSAAARSLYELLIPEPITRPGLVASLVQWVEAHRLAVAGREPAIARDVGHHVARVWLPRSRFADVEALATATLTLGSDAGAFYDLGWAQFATGRPRPALDSFEQALRLYREADDLGNEAATLTNIGRVYDGLGDRQRALAYYGQALPIRREVGDRAGEAATLTNIGRVYDGLGDRQRALAYYGQALPMMREVGDRAGEAATLTNIGRVYDGLGDRQRALAYYGQALPMMREVGD